MAAPAAALHVGIDATNIRQGGGVTHLSQLLHAADPQPLGIGHVTVWTTAATAAVLPARDWLTVRVPAWTRGSMLRRLFGQQVLIPRALRAAACDVLFSPGGTLPAHAALPTVTLSQNMLPFEPAQALLFGRWHPMRFKMWLLRHTQGRSFRRASGVIFLTRYAQQAVTAFIGGMDCPVALIPHGIEARFYQPPRQPDAALAAPTRPLRLLYVSILMPYKHQHSVAQAVAMLRREGLPVEMQFIGGDWGQYGADFRLMLQQLDPAGECMQWAGSAPFETLQRHYAGADIFVFASSCENLPNIVIEAMASGLPIACSNRGPMPEVLGDAGVYFDPYSVDSIAKALRQLVHNGDLRQQLANAAWHKSQAYSWERCAQDTLRFIAQVAQPPIAAPSDAQNKHV